MTGPNFVSKRYVPDDWPSPVAGAITVSAAAAAIRRLFSTIGCTLTRRKPSVPGTTNRAALPLRRSTGTFSAGPSLQARILYLPLGLPNVDRDRRGRGVAAGFRRQGVQTVEQSRQIVGLAGRRVDRGRGVTRDAASERLDIPAALSDPVPDVTLQARRGGGGRGAEAPDLGANPDAREQHRGHDGADDQPGGGGHD